MRIFSMAFALCLTVTAQAAPKTTESLCGALLLTTSPARATNQTEVLRYIDQIQAAGGLDLDEAILLKSDLRKNAAQNVTVIKGDEAITAYLARFNAALTEIDELGYGAYRNLTPSGAQLAIEAAKGVGAQAVTLWAAGHVGHAVGVTAAFLGAAYLVRQIGRAGYGWLTYHARSTSAAGQRLLTDEANAEFARVLREKADESIAYAVRVSIDHEYAEELQSAKDLTDLPVRALGRAILRRRKAEAAPLDLVDINQALLRDAHDGQNILLSIVRIRREVTIGWTTKKTLPATPRVIEVRSAF